MKNNSVSLYNKFRVYLFSVKFTKYNVEMGSSVRRCFLEVFPADAIKISRTPRLCDSSSFTVADRRSYELVPS